MILSRMVRRTLCSAALVSLLSLTPVWAQQSAFNAHHQEMALLPGNVNNVSVVDGRLFCYASEVLLEAQRSGEQLTGFWADTDYVKIIEDVNYVVRHPSTGDLYFTRNDKKGNSRLYFYHEEPGKKGRLKHLRMAGMSVEHPTFSMDGSIMVFSSLDRKRINFGGYDLWYSRLDNGRWSKPVNMGNRINTSSDEITPSIYRDCLLFSSNGHYESDGYQSIYSTRLISEPSEGDDDSKLQIGRCRVQRLPAPLNGDDSDNYDMAIDTLSGYGYWVSNRAENDNDSQLYSFAGALDGVQLWGYVRDQFDNPMVGVFVVALQNDIPVCNTYTDEDGLYKLYLQADQYYDLNYQLDNYFVGMEEVNTAKEQCEFLIAESQLDVGLERIPLDQRLYYNDLFGPNVDIELSERGMDRLAPLVRFLLDNPNLSVDFTLQNDLTSDASFNSILTEHRMHSIENYLLAVLPSSVKMTFHNGCGGVNGCSDASGISRLTVVISE